MLPEEKRIKCRNDYQRFLKADMQYYKDTFLKLPYSENNVLAKHIVLLRKSEYHTNTHHKLPNTHHKLRSLYYRFRLGVLQNKYSIHIPINCCDEGLAIIHVGPIMVNGNASIGKNCGLHINTGLVANGLNSKAPVLGDNVVVGFGAVVIGDVFIANHTAIGANAVVTHSITRENVAVAGIPARIISDNGTKEWNKG